MSTAAEIEAAIRELPPDERKKLARILPTLLPELDGDIAWQHIIQNSTPNARLTSSFSGPTRATSRRATGSEVCPAMNVMPLGKTF